jgi:hypothetical protein
MLRAWRLLPHERRLAAVAATGLFLTLFLPWYQRQFFVIVGGKPQPAADSQTGWGAFSFVEGAVLLVAACVLVLLFRRAEGRAFHLPGGDGTVITAAGLWACVLVIWRIFDKQGASSHGAQVTTYGIEWGIFVALAVAALLAYAGTRIRAAHQPEPPLPDRRPQPASGDRDPRPSPGGPPPPPPGPVSPEHRVRPPRPVPADDPPTRRIGPRSRPRGTPRHGDPPDEQLTIPLEDSDS